jgi:hypothetical protein
MKLNSQYRNIILYVAIGKHLSVWDAISICTEYYKHVIIIFIVCDI